MSSKAHAERLAKALEGTGLCQVVNKSNTHDQIRIMLRISPGADTAWTKIIDNILTAGSLITGQAHSYQAHICKNYFHKVVDGEPRLVFGWYISVQSNSMSESLDVVVRSLKGSLPTKDEQTKLELEEMPLSTRARDLNSPTEKGRGGWTVGGRTDFKVRR